MFGPTSPLARASSDAFNFTLLLGTGIFLLVTGLVVYMAARFRAQPGVDEPAQDFGNRRLEIGWTIGAAVLLAIIFLATFQALRGEEVETSQGATGPQTPFMTIRGHQWWWEIRYTQGNVVTANEIHLPIGQKLLVAVQSADVIHDVWIPQLGPKMDNIPGQTNYMWLEADQPGLYQGACSEYCGAEHAWMLLRAMAQPQGEFDSWLTQQEAPATAPASGNAAHGAQLFAQRTCISCHTIGGTAANAQVGPNLTHFASRSILGSGVLDNNAANVTIWLRNPQAVKPGNLMPNVRLSEEEIRDLTAYMETLK